MADQLQFIWHPDARLFAGATPIKRQTHNNPPHNKACGFCAIAALPTAPCLDQLGAQINSGHSFCIGGGSLCADTPVRHTHFMTLTGGSSGAPKTILRSQASWIQSFAQNAAMFGTSPADSIAVLGDLSHSLALYGVLEGLHLGCDVHALDGLRPDGQLRHCGDHSISILYATPTQLKRLVAASRARVLPGLRLIMCGGGDLDKATHAAMRTLAPQANVHVFYGAAETSFITISDSTTPAGSVGAAYPGVTLKILDDAGRVTHGIGELWVQSPYLFDRYAAGNSTETRWQDGFLSVGELGQLDDTGFLWLRGRKTRMVTIADQNVFPETVERFIIDNHKINDCAVLARPDALRGHHLVAVVEAPKDAVLADTIRRSCRAAFGPLIAPKAVMFVDDLPRRASGKVDHGALTRLLKGSA
tara:strand:+ start:1467 stop:2717 length:1251 start_codon:yes stop_codon:yes gene_type:complete